MPGTTPIQHFPYPLSTEPMAYDPSYSPQQTAVKSLADAVDAKFVNFFDPDVSRLTSSPRVRISRSNFDASVSGLAARNQMTTVEFNVGTDTDLSVNSTYVDIPAGLWLFTAELILPTTATNMDWGTVGIQGYGQAAAGFRIDSSADVGAAQQVAGLRLLALASSGTYGIDVELDVTSGSTTYQYAAFTAIKIADYF